MSLMVGATKEIQTAIKPPNTKATKPETSARPRGKAVSAAAQRDALMKKRKALVQKTAGLQGR